ncbi:uncharacterized protein LOC123677066 [Harmonia axyridis]|uniref:uncharacterized protein LOC123677066 n=1 Tax=Harmonia axyridis TaxID=115357 RepID=UPI001E277463|nr:uncharacterized protein LOC123677066 [Harmonia axyridis]
MKCSAKFIVLVASLHQLYFSVNSLECRYCSSADYDSDCRKGTEKETTTCTIAGEDHCYVEYILNKGQKPLYRRGCAPSDWCEQQIDNHDTALKFCKVCQGSKCNDVRIGGKDSSHMSCRKCQSDTHDSECRKGLRVMEIEDCEPEETCIYSYVLTNKRDIYERRCGNSDYCKKLEETYGYYSVESCDSCKEDLCNNEPMKFVL